MSKITGHFELTNAALQQIRDECAGNALGGGIPATPGASRFGWSDAGHFIGGSGFLLTPFDTPSPAHGSVLRDLRDVYSLGHWTERAQRHHFMRRSGAQSSRAAYDEAVEWIRSEAALAALALHANLQRAAGVAALVPPAGGGCALPNAPGPAPTRTNVFAGAASDHLGNAVHALQDSFSASHVLRGGMADDEPGEIQRVFVYDGYEKDHHADHDHGWDADGGFSLPGQLAIAATKALVVLVLDSAGRAETTLRSWSRFRDRWLVAARNLDTQAEDVTERLIRRAERRRHAGRAGSVLVLDEQALARILLQECAADAERVYRVFLRLGDLWPNLADDVAEAYVAGVQAAGEAAVGRLRAHRQLVDHLIAELDSGITMPGERRAIEFLRGLR